MLGQQLVNAAVLGSMYALIAVGFTLYFGVLNLINLAHGALYMIGAFVALTAFRFGQHLGLPLPMLIVLISVFAVAVADLSALRSRRSPSNRCVARHHWCF